MGFIDRLETPLENVNVNLHNMGPLTLAKIYH